MITFGPLTLQRHRASWHEDEELTYRQSQILYDDVELTRERYIKEAVALMVQNPADGYTELRQDESGLVWVVWATPSDRNGEALAVFTEPQARIEGYIMIVEWHWCALGQGKN